MGSWEDSPFALDGAQLEVQDLLVAIERVLANANVSPSTRVALSMAERALRAEG